MTVTFVFLRREADRFSSKFEILFRKGVCMYSYNFQYLETCGIRKWEKTKKKREAQIKAVKLCSLARQNPILPDSLNIVQVSNPANGLYNFDTHSPLDYSTAFDSNFFKNKIK
jgi:hypothetical protein